VSVIFVLFAFSVLVSSMYTSCILRNALQFLMIFLYLPIKNNIKKKLWEFFVLEKQLIIMVFFFFTLYQNCMPFLLEF
jgi:hypothetical protein